MTNDANKAAMLLQTAPYPVRVLGPLGQDAHAWGSEVPFAYLKDLHLLTHVRDLIERGLNDTVVIVLDSWDVTYMGCSRDLLKAFKVLGRPLFFSAELAFYPFGQQGFLKWRKDHADYPSGGRGGSFHTLPRCSAWRDAYRPCRPWFRSASDAAKGRCSFCVPTSLGGGYRFLNNGCWGGYAWAIERALSRVYEQGDLEKMTGGISSNYDHRGAGEQIDQIFWTLYFHAYRHEIALDYGASICLSLHGLDPKRDFAVRNRSTSGFGGAPPGKGPIGLPREAMYYSRPYWEGRLTALPFGNKEICFAHANGGSYEVMAAAFHALSLPVWGQRFDPRHRIFSLAQRSKNASEPTNSDNLDTNRKVAFGLSEGFNRVRESSGELPNR